MPLTRSDGAFDWAGLFRFPRELSPHHEHPIRIEEFMDGDVLVIRAELPDIDVASDVSVSVHGHVLRLRAERRPRHRPAGGGEFRTEFAYGPYGRSLTLPPEAAGERFELDYAGGILEIRVPCS